MQFKKACPEFCRRVEPHVDFPELEGRILKYWEDKGIRQAYLKKNSKAKRNFRFLDGPITANNPMALHHAWGRSYKDLFQRFKNMQGYRQRFQNGFDAQGLWVEVEVEKELGFKSKRDIEKYGIAKFVKKCKERVFKYAKIQSDQSKCLGYFMDWDEDVFYAKAAKENKLTGKANGSYITLSDENNYTIWHFLKKCHEKGWIYEGRDVVPWCSRCGTAISEHEIATEGYKELTHKGLFAKFYIKNARKLDLPNKRTYLLVWTTTAWTLPANVALAVGRDLQYRAFRREDSDEVLIMLNKSERIEDATRGTGSIKGLKDFSGKDLEGLEYLGLFDELGAQGGVEHKVVAADFVSTEEGTGVVHIAPGCGKEDFQLSKDEDLAVIETLDEEGVFISGFGKYSGKPASTVSADVIKDLQDKGLLFKAEDYTHRYPVCWRCGTELVFRLVDEWYIKMDELRRPMKEATRSIKWIPSWGLERELDWLNNMSDWLISKKRYWGLALPFYKCEKCGTIEVIGSEEGLKKKAISGWEKFEGHSPHRPWVDEVKIACPECKEPVSRIKDVGNPWLDAGCVPFSTLLDPKTKKVSYLTDKKYWKEWFPFDFITESFPGQFRNWFYSLLAMAVTLENKAPFKNVLGHALVRDEKGQEMHKSWGNAIEFNEAAEKMGADIMRWMYFTHDPATNINFSYGMADVIRRRFFLILWNCYKFFVDYASVDKWKPKQEARSKKQEKNILDRWIISRFNNLIKLVTQSLEGFDAQAASRAIEEFVVSDFSQWYIRRSRDRVGPTAIDEEDKEAFYQTAYEVLTSLTRLMAPLTPFAGEEIYRNLTGEKSVHLADWPRVDGKAINGDLEKDMELVRKIVEEGHSFRKGNQIKLRQPLAAVEVRGFPGFKSKFEGELKALIAEELNVKKVILKEGGGVFSLKFDTKLTDELKAEGQARELAREIQGLRKKEGLKLDDRIEVTYPDTQENKRAVELAGALIKKQTLATTLKPGKKLVLRVVR